MATLNYEALAYLIIQRQGRGIAICDMRKTKPSLRSGQAAVRIKLRIDSAVFENLIPTITAEIKASDLIEPTVEVLPAESDIADAS